MTILVGVETARGICGFGEILPARPEPNGRGVRYDQVIEQTISPQLVAFHPKSFPEALESIECLPTSTENGEPIHPIRAGVELALLDLMMRVFGRDVESIVRWMGMPGFGSPGSASRAKPAVEIPFVEATPVRNTVRRLYWHRWRHFKNPLRPRDDGARTQAVVQYLTKPLERGSASLRIDGRGFWSKDQAVEWLSDNRSIPIAAIEQPLPRGQEQDLPLLKDLFDLPLFHDESIVDVHDAQHLIELGVADGFQIDIPKCGGFIPALRLAACARRAGTRLAIGVPAFCTDLTLAPTLGFVQVCPGLEWIDYTRRTIPAVSTARKRIGLRRGSWPTIHRASGWGLDLNASALERHLVGDRIVLHF